MTRTGLWVGYIVVRKDCNGILVEIIFSSRVPFFKCMRMSGRKGRAGSHGALREQRSFRVYLQVSLGPAASGSISRLCPNMGRKSVHTGIRATARKTEGFGGSHLTLKL